MKMNAKLISLIKIRKKISNDKEIKRKKNFPSRDLKFIFNFSNEKSFFIEHFHFSFS